MDPRGDGPSISGIGDDEIHFIGRTQQCLVSFVDMANSTEIASSFHGAGAVRRYYSLFINAIASIAREGGAKVIKSAGDSLITYFPQTVNVKAAGPLRKALGCCLDICDAHAAINSLAQAEGLPPIDYRVSADYGPVELAQSKSCTQFDLIGPTMNICSKINSQATPNSLVIGGDLYEILKNNLHGKAYAFEQIGEYSAGLKHKYPVFRVRRRKPDIQDLQPDAISEVRYRIMVIDDEPDVLLTFESMLGAAGSTDVESFSDPLEALRQFLGKNPGYYSLVIADVRMPKLNGIQLSRILKSVDHDLHILLVTAHDIVEEVSSMLPEVQREYILRKPLSQETFLAKVRKAMQR